MAEESLAGADLLSLGKHCTYHGCHQLDFLPFHCQKCNGTFCVDHRREKDHNCINADLGNTTIPECPLCGQMVERGQQQSANDQIERHILSGCKDLVLSTSKKIKHSNRCTYKTCRHYELIPFRCPQCHKNYCIRHRLATNHDCIIQSYPITVTN